MIKFIISALATWRLSSLLVHEDGPGDVFAKLRTFTGMRYDEYSKPYPTSFFSSLLSCVWCVSVWVGFFIALINKPAKLHTLLTNSLALSAMAIFIDEVLNGGRGKVG